MQRKSRKDTARHHLADNVRIARATLGFSQMQLGLECGLDRTYVGVIERGEANVGIDVLDKLAARLGVAVNVLLLPPDQAQPLIYGSLRKRT